MPPRLGCSLAAVGTGALVTEIAAVAFAAVGVTAVGSGVLGVGALHAASSEAPAAETSKRNALRRFTWHDPPRHTAARSARAPHNRLDASVAPSARARSLAHCTLGWVRFIVHPWANP